MLIYPLPIIMRLFRLISSSLWPKIIEFIYFISCIFRLTNAPKPFNSNNANTCTSTINLVHEDAPDNSITESTSSPTTVALNMKRETINVTKPHHVSNTSSTLNKPADIYEDINEPSNNNNIPTIEVPLTNDSVSELLLSVSDEAGGIYLTMAPPSTVSEEYPLDKLRYLCE